MRQLFFLECKKVGTNVVYWLFVIAIVVVFRMNYGDVDKEEIRGASQPSSVFYLAQDGEYAAEQHDLSEETTQKEMMSGLTKRLLNSYKNNSYEYYPYDYIKVKTLSRSEQNMVLKYLQEITGMDSKHILWWTEDAVSKERSESGKPAEKSLAERSGDSGETKASQEGEEPGRGRYISKPGTGHMNEAGQYVFSPEEWEYVPSSADSDDPAGSTDFSIQVTFSRFMEIMDEISRMIGKNSYFSRSLIGLYYGENDMEDSPVTAKQHTEFFDGDKITGAFARYYCDSIALAVLLLPSFVVAAVMAGDRRNRMTELIGAKPVSSLKLMFIRYFAVVGMMFAPVLLLPLKSFLVLARYADTAGYVIDVLAFPKYSIGWILPTLLFAAALSLFLAVSAGSSASILVMGIFWFFFKPSVGKIAGGNYELSDIVIRHNTLKGFGRMMQHFDMLVINRILITGISFFLVLLSVLIFEKKRRGGLLFHGQEFIRDHKRKL